MDNNERNLFLLFTEAESAIAPIDDVITVLMHAINDFNLDTTDLSAEEQFDLLTRHRTLGSLLMLSINTLENIVEDFEKIRPKKEAQTPNNSESAN